METQKNKTVFIEYSSSEPGQHFMTVVQTQDHKRIIIGRIYREYDKGTKKSKYNAKDFAGNQVFVDVTDLYSLKKNFIEHGKNLADMSKMAQLKKGKQPEKPMTSLQKAERANTVKNIREKKVTKGKAKEITPKNPNTKANDNQKEQDSKNPERNKATEQGKGETNSKENVPGQESVESNSADTTQEEPIEAEKSERDLELEEIREANDDREQEQELEIDM